ncbi:MAG: hypothetical protein JWR77_640, partial [Rhizorhabdus sp.]|nr:hypothetical protein [Rhizorhabdus sp.]
MTYRFGIITLLAGVSAAAITVPAFAQVAAADSAGAPTPAEANTTIATPPAAA